MPDCMTFPDTVEEFMEQYKVVDTEQVYTNGTEFVPIYRMRQWFQHEPETHEERTETHACDCISRKAAKDAICNACGKIDCDQMDKCEKLQLPPANNSEIPNSSDTISRQAAIDALEKVAELFPWRVPGNRDSYDRYNEAWNDAIGRAEIEIEGLPSAQPPHSGRRVYQAGYADGAKAARKENT